jgi:hypothetical protein
VPAMLGKKFTVQGYLLHYSGAVDPTQDMWKSSKVTGRKAANLILTKSSAYVLEGKLNSKLAHEYKTPQFIIEAFSVSTCLCHCHWHHLA